jgi:hypothetical protein
MAPQSATSLAGEPQAISPPPGLSLAIVGEPHAVSPPPGLILAAPEAKAPIVLQLDDCLLDVKEPKVTLVLDLESSILDEKVPPSSLDVQLEDMTAQITALKQQVDEMTFHTGVSTMKKVLEDLTVRCAEVQQDTRAVPTPLRTALRSKAAPFQPFMPSTWSPHGGFLSVGVAF